MIVPPQNSLRVFLTAAKRGEGRLNGWAQDKADSLREKVLSGICRNMYMGQFSNDLDNDNDNDTWNNASIDS